MNDYLITHTEGKETVLARHIINAISLFLDRNPEVSQENISRVIKL